MTTDSLLLLDRLKRSLAAFVREIFPRIEYFGFYQYLVISWNDSEQKADMVAANPKATGLPDLVGIPVRPGLPGSKITLSSGTNVLVGFEDGDPSRPYLAFFDRLASGGFEPDQIDLASSNQSTSVSSSRRVIRDGDTVSVGTAAGPISLTGLPNTWSKVKA